MSVNLWEETLDILNYGEYSIDDISYVSDGFNEIPWDVFEQAAKNTNYDPGFGAQEVAPSLMIVMKDGSWYEREEYDGSEWWSRKISPTRPKEQCERGYYKDFLSSFYE